MSIKPIAILMKVTQMKNTPDFYEREAELVAELAAWSALAQTELVELGRTRELLKKAITLLSRRCEISRSAASSCRSFRRMHKLSVGIIARLEYQLASLRCDEPLPF
ncbi:hypothetical protein OR620_07790 [Aeromonas hydrophila]|uniref:hypothetical protein n=1 Tax=Aeromonas hydrophila TaxID=644 RepID=UPI00111BB980|nr:hypothetical protein [Aeromonas hydrophila]MCX4103681.1 hypothetical protein [Aeromonas hydrophila]TNJ21474.1 hypothetical protein CF112_10835 [Aeromonas hydrophila]